MDDKINAAAKAANNGRGEPISALTKRVTQWFHDDMDALGNLRPQAKASLSMTFRVPTPDRPLKSELMERHEFS